MESIIDGVLKVNVREKVEEGESSVAFKYDDGKFINMNTINRAYRIVSRDNEIHDLDVDVIQ